MNFNKLLSVTASAIAFLTFQGGANAQQASAPAPASKDADEDVIIITAEKRAQNLQDVPVAVSAFTDEMRDKLGIQSVSDMANFTPGLNYSTTLDRIYLRGIGRSTNNLASDGATANYSDGIYTSSTQSAGTPPIMVDRVEILRGPQGTLYGRNAIGGAINVISKRPSKNFDAEGRFTIGNYDRRVLAGTVTGPIGDALSYRLSGHFVKQDEGFFTNVAGGPSEGEDGNSRYLALLDGQIDVDITPDLNFWGRVRHADYERSYRSSASVSPYDRAFVLPGGLGPSAVYAFAPGTVAINQTYDGPAITTNPGIANLRNFSANTFSYATLDNNIDVATETTLTLGGVDIKYIAGAQNYLFHLQQDEDRTNLRSYQIPTFANPTCAPGPSVCATINATTVSHYIEDKSWWSHELNFSSNGDGPVQWLGGVYLYHETVEQPTYIPTVNTPAILMPSGSAPNPSSNIYSANQNTVGDSWAGFGQVDWAISDKWKLIAGLRYTHDKKESVESLRALVYGNPLATTDAARIGYFQALGANAAAFDITGSIISYALDPGVVSAPTVDPTTGIYSRLLADTWDATTGTLGLEWSPNDDTMLYAKYSRGYKAGGFNAGSIVALPTTGAEHIDAYEVGLKANPLDSLTTNMALFYYDYRGRQTPITVVPPSGPNRTEFLNVPKSTSIGFELESTWRPIDDLQFVLSYAYLDATVEEGCCYVDPVNPTLGGQDVAGRILPQSPKNKVALNTNYTLHFGDNDLTLSGSYFWRDETYSSFFNGAYDLAPAYDQVDLRATWDAEHYSIVLFGRNVLDEVGYEGASGSRQSAASAIPDRVAQSYALNPPQTYGVELHLKY